MTFDFGSDGMLTAEALMCACCKRMGPCSRLRLGH
jgi:hypothetical protein